MFDGLVKLEKKNQARLFKDGGVFCLIQLIFCSFTELLKIYILVKLDTCCSFVVAGWLSIPSPLSLQQPHVCTKLAPLILYWDFCKRGFAFRC